MLFATGWPKVLIEAERAGGRGCLEAALKDSPERSLDCTQRHLGSNGSNERVIYNLGLSHPLGPGPSMGLPPTPTHSSEGGIFQKSSDLAPPSQALCPQESRQH